jgi:hypothetical protein
VQGLYTNLTGTLTKVVDTRDTINGKKLTAIISWQVAIQREDHLVRRPGNAD